MKNYHESLRLLEESSQWDCENAADYYEEYCHRRDAFYKKMDDASYRRLLSFYS